MPDRRFSLRPYRAEDEDAAIALWQRHGSRPIPSIDFAARRRLVARALAQRTGAEAAIVVAEQAGALIGFVTIDRNGYLDQLVVARTHWGSALADIAGR